MERRFGMVLALLLVACGGDDKSASGDDFARLVDAACKKAVSCPLGKAQFGTYELCRGFYDLILCGEPRPQVHGVDACIKAINSGQCDELYGDDGFAACKGIDLLDVPGQTAAIGEPCDEDKNRCASSAICDADFDACGKCVATPAIGQACVQFECGDDAFCKDDTSCAAKQKSGATCGSSQECTGLCVDGTCTSLQQLLGKSCSENQDCGGLRCANGKCGALALPGEACRMSAAGDDPLFDCVVGAECEQGKCASVPTCGTGKEHDACNRTANCADPLVCNISESTCEKPSSTCDRMNGASNIQGECKRGDYCAQTSDAGAGTCKPLKADGAACESFDECASDLCAGGKCGQSACDVPSGQATHALRGQSLKARVLPTLFPRMLRP